MTFTADLTTTQGQIRAVCSDLEIEPDGILPEGKNITDELLLYFYTQEASSIGRAGARALEYAALRWATLPEVDKLAPSSVTRRKTMERLQSEARRLRQIHGTTDAHGSTGYPAAISMTTIIP